jgi:hypothetical protein
LRGDQGPSSILNDEDGDEEEEEEEEEEEVYPEEVNQDQHDT